MARGAPSSGRVRIDADAAVADRLPPRRRSRGRMPRTSPASARLRGALGPIAFCALAFATLSCGLAGLARLVCGMAGAPCDLVPALLVGVLPCLACCAVAAFAPRFSGRAVLGCLLCWGVALWWTWGEAASQAETLWRLLSGGSSDAAVDLDLLAALACALAGCLLAGLLLKLHCGQALALVCAPLLLLCPQVGHAPDVATVVLLLAYHAGASAMDRGGRDFGQARPPIVAFALALTALACAIALPAALRDPAALSALPKAIDAQVVRLIDSARGLFDGIADSRPTAASDTETALTGSAAEVSDLLGNDGTVNRGDLTTALPQIVDVHLSGQPGATLYLASFRGAYYEDGRWSAASDEPYALEVAAAAGISAETASEGLASAAYQRAKAYAAQGVDLYRITVTCDPLAIDPRTVSPYAALLTAYQAPTAGTQTGTATWSAYGIGSYDELANLGVELTSASSGGAWPQETSYAAWAQAAYLQVPVEDLPRLAQLVADNPQDGLADITSFIQETLAERAAYTTTPGTFPDDTEIAEYLLFEGHQGYCQHFATAAVLMYRLFGIPARYVTGFALPSGAFAQTGDGTWAATAGDARAHAWVEIYTEELGWVPVEVTPSSSDAAPWAEGEDGGETGTSTPDVDGGDEDADGADRDAGDGADDQAGTSGTLPTGADEDAETQEGRRDEGVGDENPSGAADTGEGPGEGDGASPATTGTTSGAARVAVATGAMAALALACGAAAMRARRRRILARRASAPANRVVADLVEVLHYGSLLADFDGTEEGFAETLADAVPALSPVEASHAVREAARCAFGPEAADPQPADERVHAVYETVCRQVHAALPRHRRLIFTYLRAYR